MGSVRLVQEMSWICEKQNVNTIAECVPAAKSWRNMSKDKLEDDSIFAEKACGTWQKKK